MLVAQPGQNPLQAFIQRGLADGLEGLDGLQVGLQAGQKSINILYPSSL